MPRKTNLFQIIMCLDILKNPAAAIIAAKKKNPRKSWLALGEACALLGLSAAVVILARNGLAQGTLMIGLNSFVGIFIITAAIFSVLGYVLSLATKTLGGKGGFHEGLTVIAYALIPMSASVLAAAVFSMIPGGVLLSSIALAIGFAYGVSMVYRGVKELFAVDMVTALVAISVLIMAMFIASSVSFALSALVRLGSIVPVMA